MTTLDWRAIRLRRSFKVAPGVRLNVSKSGVSTSLGGKGLTANLSKKGTRVTGSIRGTGLSAYKAVCVRSGRERSEAISQFWAGCSRGWHCAIGLVP
ncbi:DUF4236 domain-containing protein [Pseudomonas segetis]